MPNIKPYRHYAETDIINHFAYHGASLPKGTFVKILSGIILTDEPQNFAGPVGQTYNNTVSERWTTFPRITIAESGDTPLGMTLWTVAETDENGLPLKFNPQRAAEMQVVLSGQPIPILTDGVVIYSGSSGNWPSAGGAAYLTQNGEVGPTGATVSQVGKALGPKDANGWFMLKILV
jgi:hypothetical protein